MGEKFNNYFTIGLKKTFSLEGEVCYYRYLLFLERGIQLMNDLGGIMELG